MCRDNNHGGRRCPKKPKTRRAGDRALYAAKQAELLVASRVSTEGPVVEETSWKNLAEDNAAYIADEKPAPDLTAEGFLNQNIRDLETLLSSRQPLFINNEVTPHGKLVEEEIRRVGTLVSIQIEHERLNLLREIEEEAARKGYPPTKEERDAEVQSLDDLLTVAMVATNDFTEDIDTHQLMNRRAGKRALWDSSYTDDIHLNATEEEKAEAFAWLAEERRLLDVAEERRKAYMKKKELYAQEEKKRITVRKDATVNVLCSIRPMGGRISVDRSCPATMPSVVSLQNISAYYPSEWIRHSNESSSPLLSLAYAGARAFYNPDASKVLDEDETYAEIGKGKSVIIMPGEALMWGYDQALMVHEFAHRVEHTYDRGGAQITDIEEVFLIRRTTTNGVRDKVQRYMDSGAAGEKISEIAEDDEALLDPQTELIRPDHFTSAYMGKTYAHRVDATHKSREILSTGMEAVLGGAYGELIGKQDHQADLDHRSLILGLLAAR